MLLPSSIVNSQRSRDMCGVGPADNTGKSVVRYCPGGSLASAALRRPVKPREMIAICTPDQRTQHRSCVAHQSKNSNFRANGAFLQRKRCALLGSQKCGLVGDVYGRLPDAFARTGWSVSHVDNPWRHSDFKNKVNVVLAGVYPAEVKAEPPQARKGEAVEACLSRTSAVEIASRRRYLNQHKHEPSLHPVVFVQTRSGKIRPARKSEVRKSS